MKKEFKLCAWALFMLCSIGLITSCSPSQSSTPSIDIPELLDRSEQIQLGKEWEFVQNFYTAQKLIIANDNAAHDARLNLAELFVKEARVTGEHGHYYPAALILTDEILSGSEVDKDTRFRALLTKAGVQLSLHEFGDALATAQEAVKLNPHNAQIYGVLVDCYVELGDYKKAVAMADKMISIKPDIRSYSRISYLREIHGDYDGAIEAMTLAVKAGYPGYEETAWAMQTLGELYQLYGETEKAENIFSTILKEREDYPFAVGALGLLAYEAGDLSAAESITKRAMSIIPEVGFYTQMAQIYKDQNRTEEFENIMNEVFLMLEDDVQSGHNMNLEYADIYLHLLEDPKQALTYAEIEYVKRPKNIDVNRILAEIHAFNDNIAGANEYLEAASTTRSIHPELVALKKATKYEEQYSSL